MHPFSVLTLGIFVAGYITARWDLNTRLYELAIFAWDHSVVARTAKGAAILSIFFFIIIIPLERIAFKEATEICREGHISTRTTTKARFILRLEKNESMVDINGLLRIFWPNDVPRSRKQGVIVGWRNSSFDLFVVSVLQDVEARNTDGALRAGILYRNSSHSVERIFKLCGHSQMYVLGTVNPSVYLQNFDPSNIQVSLGSSWPIPRIFCPETNGICVQVVLYRKPSPSRMQYMSLDPISLALGDKAIVGEIDDEDDGDEKQLLKKLELHTVLKHAPTQRELLLPTILRQINCSREISQLLSKNVNLIGTRQKRVLSVSEKVVESASTVYVNILYVMWHILTIWVWPVISKAFKFGLIGHRAVAEVTLRVLEWRPRGERSAALKDISATAQQIDIRLQQFCYWPIQYTTLRKRKQDWDSVTDSHPDYIRFYNSLWLVANDVIIGIALGSYIIDHAGWVAAALDHYLSKWTIHGLKEIIIWLTDWPAGLKLNNELAGFLGDLFIWVIEVWAASYSAYIKPVLPHLIYFIGFSSFAGASMPIAVFSDLSSLLTVHVYSFYVASAKIYHWQLTIIVSLFHLFRGKKHNVLRNRIDSCDYDLDQLLLGTILFTLLAFLLPTVLVFYLTFAFSRMAIITLRALLDTSLACLNHFPLFALMLRVKDSRRLPGGVSFELRDTPFSNLRKFESNSVPPTSCVLLKSVPLSLRDIFDQYFKLSGRIRSHYFSAKVAFYLATGQFVPPIERQKLYSMQYSMLPARRADVFEVWRCINEKGLTQNSKVNGVLKISNGFPNSSRRSR